MTKGKKKTEKAVKKGITFALSKADGDSVHVIHGCDSVHVMHGGRVIAMIRPDTEMEMAIAVESQQFTGLGTKAGPFTKSVSFDQRPGRTPSVIILFSPEK